MIAGAKMRVRSWDGRRGKLSRGVFTHRLSFLRELFASGLVKIMSALVSRTRIGIISEIFRYSFTKEYVLLL